MKLNIGPGALVAAGFIGPGTVTACTLAGANFGYALIWGLVFATFATIILQEMAARLGIVSGKGLAAAMTATENGPVLKWLVIGLGISALAVGNAAYEAGNLAGGALGLEALLGPWGISRKVIVPVLSATAGCFLVFGHYRHIEKLLIGLVLLMTLAFAGSVAITRPDMSGWLGGLRPAIPDGGLLTAIALIGTTIVPYNLFLHASTVRDKWPDRSPNALRAARLDTAVSIGLGGLVSILILSTAAASLFGSGIAVSSAADMAISIEPAYGPVAKYLVGIGLFGAGLSSAITAPLATAYALSEFGGFQRNGRLFRMIALAVLLIGTAIALLGVRPISVILFAQVANGLILPVIATFLLVAMNRRSLLGDHVNSWLANILGVGVVIITFGLGLRLILRALNVWS
jgi:manganese transport protein